jgi:D-serine deaminase-like pyridoxal phosphate-dependent protein
VLGEFTYPELDTPTVLVDLDVLEANLARTAGAAKQAGVKLRPHTKTHKSVALASMQVQLGASGLTVAKLGEAEVLLAAGFTDLLVAYPIVGDLKLMRLKELAQRATITVALDDLTVARSIGAIGRELGTPVSVYLEVDSGHHRCGHAPGAPSAALASEVAQVDGIRLAGLMTHAGHAYAATDSGALRSVALEEARALVETAEMLEDRGIAVRELSLGSTPTFKYLDEVASRYRAITEARPGTYVFNDINQVLLGVATEAECALGVLATVVSRPTQERVIVDAGSKTLGSDKNGEGYGRIAGSNGVLERLSEEHGILRVPRAASWSVGDRLTLIPAHVCLVPNLTASMVGVRGDEVVMELPVDGRGQNR